MRLCAVTDEIAPEVEKAVSIGLEEGIRTFELRSIGGKRFPFYTLEDFDKLVRLKEDKGIEFSAISPGIFKIGIDETPWEKFKKLGYSDIYRKAESLDCSLFIVFAEKNYTDQTKYTEMISSMKKFIYRARKRDMKVCIENSANTCCNSSEQILKILKDIDEKSLYVNWDPGNAATGNVLDIEKDYDILRPYILNMHIKDVLIKDDGGKYFVPIGDGIVDYEKILYLLIKDGFQGCLTIETHCGQTEEAFRKSVQYMKKLLKQ